MDFQHRAGGKTGVGGVASASDANRDRRERLRQLALETIDLNKDPYFMKNHLGSYECKLCLTLHNNEGSYLAHTQGKKHQANLSRRAAKEAKDAPAQPAPEKARVDIKKFIKIGRPGYKVTKQRDPDSGQQSLLYQIDYPEVVEGCVPRHRFMAAYEQKIEPPDKKWQYLLFAAEPYETIAFKVPSREVDKDPKKFWTHWNRETKQFFLQFAFKLEQKPMQMSGGPALKFPASLPPPPQQTTGPNNPPSRMPPPPPTNFPPPNSSLPPHPSNQPPQPPMSLNPPGGPPSSMGGPMSGPPPPMPSRGPPAPPGSIAGPPMGGPPSGLMGGPSGPLGGPPRGPHPGGPMGGSMMGGPMIARPPPPPMPLMSLNPHPASGGPQPGMPSIGGVGGPPVSSLMSTPTVTPQMSGLGGPMPPLPPPPPPGV